MKITRNILFCLAILFLFMNTFALRNGYGTYYPMTDEKSEIIGYYIGLHFLFALGIIFLVIVFSLNKKIKRKKIEDLKMDIDSVGQDIPL